MQILAERMKVVCLLLQKLLLVLLVLVLLVVVLVVVVSVYVLYSTVSNFGFLLYCGLVSSASSRRYGATRTATTPRNVGVVVGTSSHSNLVLFLFNVGQEHLRLFGSSSYARPVLCIVHDIALPPAQSV